MKRFRSRLYQGSVMHHRLSPKVHRFNYAVFSICIDLDELESLDSQLRWFSLNRFNLFSFYPADHCRDSSLALKEDILKRLQDEEWAKGTVRIELLCYPRVLGYVFNPLSCYFCYDQQNNLLGILYEVSNTFGEQHSYPLEAKQDQRKQQQRCEKAFYVSPFMPFDCEYQFSVTPPNESVDIHIRQTQQQDTIFIAAFSGRQQSLTDNGLLINFIKYPLMTIKVIAAIHWEALRLWKKGLKLQPRLPPQTTGHAPSNQSERED